MFFFLERNLFSLTLLENDLDEEDSLLHSLNVDILSFLEPLGFKNDLRCCQKKLSFGSFSKFIVKLGVRPNLGAG